jgi:DNA (cytosine-5)-methyltransferase 1
VKVLDLFAGIGGFTLGLERSGFEAVAFCEIDPYAQKVLKKNWPEVPIYDDVRTITAERLAADGIRVDVITGGFPCQDISVAGSQAGIEGDRSGLWSECARLLGELRPQYAIFENVTNLLNGERGAWFKRVLWDISSLGYDAEWHCIPASELGAHHHRDRIWIIAYPNSTQRQRGSLSIGVHKKDANIIGSSGWQTEPSLGRVANGVPSQSYRLKCLGNAVVPPIPELIGRAIK